MILPYSHTKEMNVLSKDARNEIMEVLSNGTQMVNQILKPDGFNIGLNIGKASGAGIPSHLHWHIVPRWHGDTNYLTTIGDIKIVSFDLKDIFAALKPGFN